jgi:hypothetical protein
MALESGLALGTAAPRRLQLRRHGASMRVMSFLRTLACASALVAGCASLRGPASVESSVLLGPAGRAVATLHSAGTERIFLRVDNSGPGSVAFTVRDHRDRVLEQGQILRESRLFEFRPLERDLELQLEADQRGARLAYRMSSVDGVSVEWNLTGAHGQ